MKNFDHITYESLGVDPKEFYSDKFIGARGDIDWLDYKPHRFHIEFSRARFLARNVKGPRVLDLGCGSAPFAETLRVHSGVQEFVGLDLDPVCIENAARVCDHAAVFDVNDSLPFPDRHFDTVFSCDFFGHIEFRHKDRLIAEIRRVTKDDGRSVHVIESAPLDYDLITDDPDDPIRKYVLMEGHIGMESADALIARWSRAFGQVTVENAMLYPFTTVPGYLLDPVAPEELKVLLREYSIEQQEAANVLLGYVMERMIEWYRSQQPELLCPAENHPIRRASGLVNLVASGVPVLPAAAGAAAADGGGRRRKAGSPRRRRPAPSRRGSAPSE